MKVKKTVIGELEKCYALAMLEYDRKKHFLVAAEKSDKCQMFDLDGNLEETIWEGPGGVMSMVQVPGSNGQFLATHKFYSPNDSKEAKIVIAEPGADGKWEVRTLAELPFVHRFDILKNNGINYLIACTLKSGHEYKDDWTHPGKVFAAVLPEDLSDYNEKNQLELKVIREDFTRNHGYYRCNTGNCESAVISCDSGVYLFSTPDTENGNWDIRQLIDVPSSDAVLMDLDGDGMKELFVLSPFHGNTVSIYKEYKGIFEKIYEYPEKPEFLHAIFGGEINGRPMVIVGHRKGERNLLAFYSNHMGGYHVERLDSRAGAANVLHYCKDGREIIIAANREINEIAMYELGR